MARERFAAALDRLRDTLVEMGRLVVDRLDDAAAALEHEDAARARRVVEGDVEVNQLYREVESQCIDLFALQQPVASDLRRVASTFKISTDLERVGDLAVNLAQYSRELNRDLYAEVALSDIVDAARRMVADAVELYAEDGDEWRCHELADRDTELDAMCAHAGRVVTLALLDHQASADDAAERLVEDVSTLLLTVRDLERVGDHAVNVAARTLYVTEGDDSLLE
ncbi:phosphate signaling complex protein PhoU [Salinirubellus salinus]|uniref:Phosphate-specific transport system accessory protein PhoU n=1 Tax=Salinirubellus salinus TaxID=1364945 RepID=A0A9E7R477_9EURY|nr:phosphate signaling complex protein PhoU [Salinirubellus salinus]UWM55551.1 phosphate signaling complex protein PhoU [Salinirubellus salinus]